MHHKRKVQREKCSSTKNAESAASKLLDSTTASLAVMHAKENGSNNSNMSVRTGPEIPGPIGTSCYLIVDISLIRYVWSRLTLSQIWLRCHCWHMPKSSQNRSHESVNLKFIIWTHKAFFRRAVLSGKQYECKFKKISKKSCMTNPEVSHPTLPAWHSTSNLADFVF